MKYVFGPVPSRRLGRSLGVDPIPFKTCNWNCVYCQLGRTFPLTVERREYVPAAEVVAEAREALARQGADYVTFVGSGEPTLHSRLGWMLRELRDPAGPPLAVVTNGSLLHLPQVREELMAADVVLPTLDAGSELLYRRLNRPHRSLGFAEFVEGLATFSRGYPGRLCVEVMLVAGRNDDDEALADLATALAQVGPDEVHLNVPVRPPVEPWVQPPTHERLERARQVLGAVAHVLAPPDEDVATLLYEDPAEAVQALVQRHPMDAPELRRVLGRWPAAEIDDAITRLERQGAIRPVERSGRIFWVHGEAAFA